jgi:hypothetical protein
LENDCFGVGIWLGKPKISKYCGEKDLKSQNTSLRALLLDAPESSNYNRRMNSLIKVAFLSVVVSGLISGCATAKAQSDWIPIFDGSSTNALRAYKKDSFPATEWKVEGGVLKSVAGQRVDLITKERFKDFELEMEWAVKPGGNSGVFYGVQETDKPTYHTGPEMQILDDDGHPDGKTPSHRTGSLYALIEPNAKKKLKPVGEFNKAKVVAKNGHVEHWLNGEKLVEYDWGSPEIKALVAQSKFSKMPRFMENMEGHVSLQHHGDEVWFRNVRIRRL